MKKHTCEHCGELVDHSVIAREMLFQINRSLSSLHTQTFAIPCPHCDKPFQFTNEDDLTMRDSG